MKIYSILCLLLIINTSHLFSFSHEFKHELGKILGTQEPLDTKSTMLRRIITANTHEEDMIKTIEMYLVLDQKCTTIEQWLNNPRLYLRKRDIATILLIIIFTSIRYNLEKGFYDNQISHAATPATAAPLIGLKNNVSFIKNLIKFIKDNIIFSAKEKGYQYLLFIIVTFVYCLSFEEKLSALIAMLISLNAHISTTPIISILPAYALDQFLSFYFKKCKNSALKKINSQLGNEVSIHLSNQKKYLSPPEVLSPYDDDAYQLRCYALEYRVHMNKLLQKI